MSRMIDTLLMQKSSKIFIIFWLLLKIYSTIGPKVNNFGINSSVKVDTFLIQFIIECLKSEEKNNLLFGLNY
jgi:cytochrome c oxidase subunit IV